MTMTATADHGQAVAGPRRSPVKTLAFAIAILAIQLGFILSYVGAFHAPTAHGISVAVVAPASVQRQVVSQLNEIKDTPIAATGAASPASAMSELRNDSISGIFTVSATGTNDTLTVAGAGGASTATALETVFRQADAAQHRTVTVTDAIPVQPGDGRGLTVFYLVTGWLVGSYLLAAVLGILLGTKLTGTREAAKRIAIFVPYAIASGIGGAVVIDQGLGAVTGHFWAIAAVGALVIMAGAMATVALQSLLGIIGVGVTIIVFVVLGNPSAGGAYQQQLLPPFWQAISQALPNGAATSALRNVIYFGGQHTTGDIALIAAYAAAGTAVTLITASARSRRAKAAIHRHARAAFLAAEAHQAH